MTRIDGSEFLADLEKAAPVQAIMFNACGLCGEFKQMAACFEWQREYICADCLKSLIEEYEPSIPEERRKKAVAERKAQVAAEIASREEHKLMAEKAEAEKALKTELAAKEKEFLEAKAKAEAELRAKYAGKLPEPSKPVWEVPEQPQTEQERAATRPHFQAIG
jgi:hypothetical protein